MKKIYCIVFLAFLFTCDNNNCEEMQTIVIDCKCSIINPNTFTVFVTIEDNENCEIIEDCYCECFNDVNGNGVCDEDE